MLTTHIQLFQTYLIFLIKVWAFLYFDPVKRSLLKGSFREGGQTMYILL